MREFFQEILTNLKIYCGNDQVKNIRAAHSKIEDAENEIRMLLDALCNISKLFDYIPEEEQKTIIRKCLLSDKDYQNLNVRLIHRWLSENGKMYFKEEAHKPIEYFEPAPREVAEKYIEQFKANLKGIGKTPITRITDEEIQEEGQERPKEPKYISDQRYAIEHANKLTEARRKVIRERHPELTDQEIEQKILNMPL